MFALPNAFDRRVAQLPDSGTLLVCTDLQGNLGDYQRVLEHFGHEQQAGNDPVLVFSGDLVHGPSPGLLEPGKWPVHLGTPYADRSAELVRSFAELVCSERVVSLLGNHEHAHIGGPVVPKFWDDEAAVLDRALGDDRERIHVMFRSLPLLAVAPCGVVLTHAAPHATAPTLEAFEALEYEGYTDVSLWAMADHDVLGALTWARQASESEALELLEVCTGRRAGVVVRGHDIVRAGVARSSRHELILSSSFGLHDADKCLLRVDLAGDYPDAASLRDGFEIVPLHPVPRRP